MLVRLPLLALAGTLAGLLLGETIAKPLAAVRGGAGPASYAQYSANPDARVPEGATAAPCLGCPDSYGVAARLRAEREPRIDAFRELGAVEIDAPLPPEPADNTYQYGGRFPDPALPIETPIIEGSNPPAIEDEAQPTEPPARRLRDNLKQITVRPELVEGPLFLREVEKKTDASTSSAQTDRGWGVTD